MSVTAVVLCGGKGSRLAGVLPPNTPKCLAPVAGKPFLHYVLEHLALQGVYKAVLCTGVHGDVVERTCGNRFSSPYWEMQLVHSREETPLGTGGALRNALPLMDTDPVLVVNGDTYCPFDLAAMLERHREREAGVTYWGGLFPHGSGVLLTSWEWIGNLELPYSLEKNAEWAVNSGELYWVGPDRADYHDIGTPERYAAAEAVLREWGAIRKEDCSPTRENLLKAGFTKDMLVGLENLFLLWECDSHTGYAEDYVREGVKKLGEWYAAARKELEK